MRPLAWSSLVLIASWGVSCGGERTSAQAGGMAGSAAGPNGTAGTMAAQPVDEDTVGLDIGNGDASIVPALGPANACLSEVREAERIAVDLFVMLDRSGSMLAETGMLTKWEAVRSALINFLQDPLTEQVGVGLRVFPQLEEGVPLECFSDDECGDGAPCSIPGLCPDSTFCTSDLGCVHPNDPARTGFCENAPQFPCTPGSQCTAGRGECLLLECTNGFCADDPSYVCVLGSDCVDDSGGDLGACLPMSGYCVQGDSCTADVYATPDVPITLGAARNPALITALEAATPTGFTPTTPALQGAIQYAQTWSETHPERVAAVVLATDGFPSECTALNQDLVEPVLQAAQAGAAGRPPIRTYVVGVFSADDAAAGAGTILNAMATAGNTGQAFLVDTQGNVGDDFLAALQTISAQAVACEFLLPQDDTLNFDSVNLLLTRDDGQEVQLVNVGSSEGCTANDDVGWYYLNDAATGVPSQISVCPGVCQQFANIGGGRVDLQIGCETIIR